MQDTYEVVVTQAGKTMFQEAEKKKVEKEKLKAEAG